MHNRNVKIGAKCRSFIAYRNLALPFRGKYLNVTIIFKIFLACEAISYSFRIFLSVFPFQHSVLDISAAMNIFD